jgi:hypothetical protein
MRVAELPIAAVLRSRTISETRGFMKALVEADGNRILGFTMIGPEAGEVMAVVGHALHGLARCDYRSSDNGGRACRALFNSTSPIAVRGRAARDGCTLFALCGQRLLPALPSQSPVAKTTNEAEAPIGKIPGRHSQ